MPGQLASQLVELRIVVQVGSTREGIATGGLRHSAPLNAADGALLVALRVGDFGAAAAADVHRLQCAEELHEHGWAPFVVWFCLEVDTVALVALAALVAGFRRWTWGRCGHYRVPCIVLLLAAPRVPSMWMSSVIWSLHSSGWW